MRYTDNVPVGYQKLLNELGVFAHHHASSGWYMYIRRMARSEESLLQDRQFVWGKDHFLHDIIDSCINEARQHVAPTLTERVCIYVDKKRGELTEKESEILARFYGLGREAQSFEAIGAELDLTRERVRQIKEKACRRLRNRLSFPASISNAWEECLLLKEEHQNELLAERESLKKQLLAVDKKYKDKLSGIDHPIATEMLTHIDAGWTNNENLFLRMVDLDLSVRALNCLKCADIDYLWQLAVLKRDDLFSFRNFGRKTLTELESVFSEKEVTFDMKFTPAEMAYLRSKTTERA